MRFLIVLFFSLIVHSASGQKIDQTFFNDVDQFLKANVSNGLVDYASLTSSESLTKLINEIANADLQGLDTKTKQAFYINAYNLNVINKVANQYPINSVMDKGGFFDRDKINVANTSLTLNKLEKENLLATYNDPRFHFVLVCGALGCPPITDFAYTPQSLETQIAKQTQLAINDANFIKFEDGKLKLSEIFKWYANDFGSSPKNILKFINQYRSSSIPEGTKIGYYNYDWNLNGVNKASGDYNAKASNTSRYIVSSTVPKGSVEIKIFNNLYSQKTGDAELTNRSSFFTTSLSAIYGLSNRFNVGISTRYRKVRNNALPSSPFSVFGDDDQGSSRSGLTAFGPQIRYAPVPKWTNFSIQSSFVFPIGNDLAGNDEDPYIDWTGATWNTQFFNDFSIGNKFSLFTEIDFLIEDIGSGEEGHLNRVSTPATLIFSFVPNQKMTFYALGGYSPYWQSSFDYFVQYGVGTKYQFTPNFELELLYTDFTNKFLNETNGQAETINLGLRFNI